MKIKALIFGSDGITVHSIQRILYPCHHVVKSEFLSFDEPIIFRINGSASDKKYTLMVSEKMKDNFLLEDSIFYKILEAIPSLKLKNKNTPIREVIKQLIQVNPVQYNLGNHSLIYEAKFRKFLCHLAMGFYSASNQCPTNFSYKSMMLWDRYRPVWMHVNDLATFTSYLLEHSSVNLNRTTDGVNVVIEMKIRFHDKSN